MIMLSSGFLVFGMLLYILIQDFLLEKRVAFLVVEKRKLRMEVYNAKGRLTDTFTVAVGTNLGDKKMMGDLRTPEGVFPVVSVENSSSWKYDFEEDDAGPVVGAYGPWFIRLEVPGVKGIGIHGTHDKSTIGKRVSHGCIRMRNEDLEYLKKWISNGVRVIITPDSIPVTQVTMKGPSQEGPQ